MADFQNPNQEQGGGGDRRMFLILAVLLVVMAVAQPLLKKYLPQPPAPQTQTQNSSASTPTAAASASAAPAVAVPTGVTKQASGETETVIDNDLYKITFTNRGAQVKSWILKKFDNETQNGPLDLVNAAAAQKFGYPLSLWTYDETLRNRLSSALYVASREGAQASPTDVTFEYADQDLAVRKTFHFDHTYVVHVETSVTYKGATVPALPAWPSGFGDQATLPAYAASLIDYQFNNNIERLSIKKISGGATISAPFHWGGALDQYFAAIFIPDDPASSALVTLRNSIDNPQDAKHPYEIVGAAAGNLHGATMERVYVGPKELAVLEKTRVPGITGADPDLNGLVDFGWWGIIAKPLFVWLRWTYFHVVQNWGWAIMVQTLIIGLALTPLRVYGTHSMYKMQKVAPQVKAIQEKYKKYSLKDPRKAAMNEEISALYKKEGANPVTGCLPLLIQMPFLIAYYRMLGTALDLRHAHWLWIHDLSSPEMGLIRLLPIAMVVSMLITQKMTPQAGMDPAQQRMMTVMMPAMMGFIFWNLAAGLNLYYTLSNLISIAQQAAMNRTKLGREMREMMQKRARKKEK